jgi:hypothetical protein
MLEKYWEPAKYEKAIYDKWERSGCFDAKIETPIEDIGDLKRQRQILKEKISQVEKFVKDTFTDEYVLLRLSFKNEVGDHAMMHQVFTKNKVSYRFFYDELNDINNICAIISDIVEKEIERVNLFVKNNVFSKVRVNGIFFDIWDEFPNGFTPTICFEFGYTLARKNDDRTIWGK